MTASHVIAHYIRDFCTARSGIPYILYACVCVLAAPQVGRAKVKCTRQVSQVGRQLSRVETMGVGGEEAEAANSNGQAELLVGPAKEQRAQITDRKNRTWMNQR